MSTNTDSDSVDEEQIDPRLETAFGSKFENSKMSANELGEALAEIHDDYAFERSLANHIDAYLGENYELDLDTRVVVRAIMAKEAFSGIFPYRNAMVTAEMVDIQTGDRVYAKQDDWDADDRDHVVKEYAVVQIRNHGTDLVIEERVHYDLEDNVIAEPRTKDFRDRARISPNTAQVEHDDSWYVQRLNREDE